jgi:hypothetical protein
VKDEKWLYMPGVPKMRGQISRLSYSQEDKEVTNINICPEMIAFEFDWKIAVKNMYTEYVI